MSSSQAPSDSMKLIASGVETVTSGATGEDLATFPDITAYDYILVAATIVAITGVTPTQLDVKFRTASAANGTTGAALAQLNGADIIGTIVGAEFAVGSSILLQVRTRGLKQFGSPLFLATAGTSVDVAFTVIGVGVRDTKELGTHWVAGASSEVVESVIS